MTVRQMGAAAVLQPDSGRIARLRIYRSGQTTSSGEGESLARATTTAGASGSGSAVASDQRKAKRKKEVPDLDAIDDIAERRKQRRLAKNRATAAVSRYAARAAACFIYVRGCTVLSIFLLSQCTLRLVGGGGSCCCTCICQSRPLVCRVGQPARKPACL